MEQHENTKRALQGQIMGSSLPQGETEEFWREKSQLSQPHGWAEPHQSLLVTVDQHHPQVAVGGGLVAQSCPTLCDASDSSATPPGSSVHGISWARILEWVAISYSRGSSQPRD